MRYRKKPVVIDAVRFTGDDSHAALDDLVATAHRDCAVTFVEDRLEIHTLEGIMLATAGDYIIRGIKGELYPCKPEIFEATYEAVDA